MAWEVRLESAARGRKLHLGFTTLACLLPCLSPTAMRRVLSMPELVDLIFGFLQRPGHAAGARVCRAWVDIARDHIWEVVDNPCILFQNLAPIKGAELSIADHYDHVSVFEQGSDTQVVAETLHFSTMTVVRASSNSRRLGQISSIRSSCSPFNHPPSRFKPCILSRLSERCLRDECQRQVGAYLNILPNLHTLEWKNRASDDGAYPIMFLHEGVKSLAVPVFPCQLGPPYSIRAYFQDILSQAPALTTLSLYCEIDDPELNSVRELENDLLFILDRLAIRVLSPPLYYLTRSLAERLSEWEFLEFITFSYQAGATEGDCRLCTAYMGGYRDVTDFTPDFKPRAFRALSGLSLAASLQET
ncbi:hypothetical protein BV25DRAFT_242145 [Artomyces pyxidatus]|uniref:Uncharacterized protein n=1 Tax=Artomyces pyxidatus TaxID=48021 RepID=A0ACB8T6L1_9AGAM|nr:hypothetical protein BV25DRAFT_242145 [Artomyces pyxidatus]